MFFKKPEKCKKYIISSCLELEAYVSSRHLIHELNNHLVLQLIFGEKFIESSNVPMLFESENYAVKFSQTSLTVTRDDYFDFSHNLREFNRIIGARVYDIRSISVQFELFIPSELDIKPIFFQDRICKTFDKASLTLAYKEYDVTVADAINDNSVKGLYLKMSKGYKFDDEINYSDLKNQTLEITDEFATKFGILT